MIGPSPRLHYLLICQMLLSCSVASSCDDNGVHQQTEGLAWLICSWIGIEIPVQCCSRNVDSSESSKPNSQWLSGITLKLVFWVPKGPSLYILLVWKQITWDKNAYHSVLCSHLELFTWGALFLEEAAISGSDSPSPSCSYSMFAQLWAMQKDTREWRPRWWKQYSSLRNIAPP